MSAHNDPGGTGPTERQPADPVRWHAHGFVFVHAHPHDPPGHDHFGYTLVAAMGEAAELVDDQGGRLPGETTMLEAIRAARFDGSACAP